MDGDSYRARPADWTDDRTDRGEDDRQKDTVAPAQDRFNAHAVLRALARHEGAQAEYSDEMYDDTEVTAAGDAEAPGCDEAGPAEASGDAWEFSTVDDPVADPDDEAPADAFAPPSGTEPSAESLDSLEEFLAEDDAPDGEESPDEAASMAPEAFHGETDALADAWDDSMESASVGVPEEDEAGDDPEAGFEEDGDPVGAAEPQEAEAQPWEFVAESEGSDLGEPGDDVPADIAEPDDAAETFVAADEHLGIDETVAGTDPVEDGETEVAESAWDQTDDIPLFDAEADSHTVPAAGDPVSEIDEMAQAEDDMSGAAEEEPDEGSDLASIIGALGLNARTDDVTDVAAAFEPASAEQVDDAPASAHHEDWDGATDEPRPDHEVMDDDTSILASIALASAEDEPSGDAEVDDDAGLDAPAQDVASEDHGDDDEEAAYAAPGAGAAAAYATAQVFASIDDPDLPGRKPRIALMGEFSAGKSTLSNLLIGASPLPTRVTATQLPPVWISWGEGQAYREDLDGTTHAIDVERIGDIDPAQTRVIRLFCQSDILELCDIIDMPGISDPNMSSEVWERVIGKADGVIWCTHATQAWRQSEAAVWESLDPALFAKSLLLITRFDKLRTEIDRARVLKRVERETRDLFAARLPISLTGALGAGEDAEKWEQSGAADFTDRLVSLLNDLSSSLGSKSRDPLDRSLADADRPAATPRPRSVQVHRPRTETLATPQRVMPRRVRPVAEGGQRNAHP